MYAIRSYYDTNRWVQAFFDRLPITEKRHMSILKFISVTLLIFLVSCRQTENDSAGSDQPKIDELISKVSFYSKSQLDSILEYANRDT